MGVPTSEVGYTAAMPTREDHEVHKGHVEALGGGWQYTPFVPVCNTSSLLPAVSSGRPFFNECKANSYLLLQFHYNLRFCYTGLKFRDFCNVIFIAVTFIILNIPQMENLFRQFFFSYIFPQVPFSIIFLSFLPHLPWIPSVLYCWILCRTMKV